LLLYFVMYFIKKLKFNTNNFLLPSYARSNEFVVVRCGRKKVGVTETVNEPARKKATATTTRIRIRKKIMENGE